MVFLLLVSFLCMSRRPTRDSPFCLRGRDVPPVSPVEGTSREGERGRLRREREQFIILQRPSSSSSEDEKLIESPRKKKKVFIPQLDEEMAVQGIGQQIAELGQIFQQNNAEVLRQNELFNEARREAVEHLNDIAGRIEAARDRDVPPAQRHEEEEVVDDEQGMLRNNNALIGRLLPEKYCGTEAEDPKDFISQCDITARQFYGADADRFCILFPGLLKKSAHLWYVNNHMREVQTWQRVKERFLERFDSVTDSEKVEMKTKKMKEGQTIAEFIQDFEYRIHRAGVDQEEEIMGLFFQGILPFYRSKLMSENLLNVQQAYARAREMEIELKGIKQYAGGDSDKTLKAVTALLDQVKKMNAATAVKEETIKPSVAVIQGMGTPQQPRQPPQQQQQQQQNQPRNNQGNKNRNGQANRETRSCHYCGKEGHLMRDCYKKQKDEREGQSSNQGGQQRSNNNPPRGPPRQYGSGNQVQGRGQPRQNGYNNFPNRQPLNIQCYQCGNYGHIARNCYLNGGQASTPAMQFFQGPAQAPRQPNIPAQVFGTFQVDANGQPLGYAATGNVGPSPATPQATGANHPNQ